MCDMGVDTSSGQSMLCVVDRCKDFGIRWHHPGCCVKNDSLGRNKDRIQDTSYVAFAERG